MRISEAIALIPAESTPAVYINSLSRCPTHAEPPIDVAEDESEVHQFFIEISGAA